MKDCRTFNDFSRFVADVGLTSIAQSFTLRF